MTEQVVVLGSGYAGAGAVQSLESSLSGDAEITWVSDVDYHLILHETHRCISDPSVKEKVAIPIEEIKSSSTEFIQATVEGVDTDERTVDLEDGETIGYDYLLVGLGTQTAFFGIDGLKEHAHTLKSLDDALGIHDAVVAAADEATQTDPAQIVIGGAGLSGIQTAGEIARLRDERSAPLDIHLVEGLDEIFPGNDDSIQSALRDLLEERNVNILTGEFIGEVDDDTVYIGEETELDYDVLIWTGGITGREAVRDANVDKDERNYRLEAGQTFQTSDDRVFAIGDAALIDQPGDDPAPPTAQAAWQAAEVAGENIAREIRGQPLKNWTYKDKGTVVSVGEDAVAHDVYIIPFVDTFGGFPARTLKKAIAANWISDITGVGRAVDAWADM
ncbi:FAD-dependent oxidoreductase [Halovenus sp. WSH3]|uniref:FAD-dependent oxidoreductase n=1 Tax=Halovenus carboxidivorans TaxID=2692199 RepID=A0A6B0T5C5_9EURY|nr:NAD(P)/FAD-dependent oxidoreductase [Halovenus carboxidivorans]MXR51386.1 FAD-dependent oxidoreductase [Halovenus carboxidivorans]